MHVKCNHGIKKIHKVFTSISFKYLTLAQPPSCHAMRWDLV